MKAIQFTKFITCLCDKVPTIDNDPWICVHVYVVQSWTKVPDLLFVECIVDGLGSNNLIEVIMVTLVKNGGLIRDNKSRMLCFGVDGVFIFWRGNKSHMANKRPWAPFSMGVHCVDHRTNLVIKSLFNFDSHCLD
jgi:hypothetical protein